MNKSVNSCCQTKQQVLNQLSTEQTSIIKNLSEWIKATKGKELCSVCKEFRADSLCVMDKKAAEEDKNIYLKKYFKIK